ncbi:4Fe-4S dicluster domain-containing protein [Candidatus Bathyarchaeota archaeon]|nr:4Fe-4S dicluster domain-containing protein [Candidatus Bathyarchaeota archaeon]
MNKLQEELSTLVRASGADLFGVADLRITSDFIRKQGGEFVAKYPRAISIGIRLLDAVVDELIHHEEPSVIFTYRGLYNSANASLDRTTLLIAKKIQEKRFNACPIPASQMINSAKLEGAFSHKLAAHQSGLGWIGKSCLLITPEHGPRVRLATVLTDAPLKSGAPLARRCGNCTRCVDICPAKAFTGVPFDPSEPREVRFKAHLCDEYTDRREKLLGEGLCGLCVFVCPYGATKHSKAIPKAN